MIEIVIADDSPTARRLLSEALGADPEIEVVGLAEDGEQATEMVEQLRPRVVVMDVEMPTLNGFEATKEIMIRRPTPTLIVTGAFDVGDRTFQGNTFRSGAVTAFPKLPDPGSAEFDDALVGLRDAVKDLAGVAVCRHWRYAPLLSHRLRGGDGRVGIICVVTSSRAAPDFARLLAGLPEDLDPSVLVVPHLGHGFTGGYAAWLARNCALDVRVAEAGEPLRPGVVYIAPEDRHLGIGGEASPGMIVLSDAPARRGFRPSGSFLRESVADGFGHAAVAVMLDAPPEDVVLGQCAIRLDGGRVLVQETKRHGRLQGVGAGLEAGLADAVLPLERIAEQLAEACLREPDPEEEDLVEAEALYGSGGLSLAT